MLIAVLKFVNSDCTICTYFRLAFNCNTLEYDRINSAPQTWVTHF